MPNWHQYDNPIFQCSASGELAIVLKIDGYIGEREREHRAVISTRHVVCTGIDIVLCAHGNKLAIYYVNRQLSA